MQTVGVVSNSLPWRQQKAQDSAIAQLGVGKSHHFFCPSCLVDQRKGMPHWDSTGNRESMKTVLYNEEHCAGVKCLKHAA